MRYILVLALAALALAAPAAQADVDSPGPLCVVIDDAGHCAPPGLGTPSAPINSGVTTEPGWDATGCKWRRTTMGWAAGSLGFQLSYKGIFRWCSSGGIIRKRSIALDWSSGPLCGHYSHTHYLNSGGVGYGWWDHHLTFTFSCGMPWGLPYYWTHWIDTRVKADGTAYITNWKGKA